MNMVIGVINSMTECKSCIVKAFPALVVGTVKELMLRLEPYSKQSMDKTQFSSAAIYSMCRVLTYYSDCLREEADKVDRIQSEE